MAYEELHSFLVTLSKHSAMRKIMKDGGQPAEQLMTEAGLSDQEKTLVRGGDEAAIRKYLGEQCSAASMVNIVD